MNKAELITAISQAADLTKVEAEKAINAFTDTVVATLKKGEKVALVGFGTFAASERKARTGRNPQTGKEIKIAAKTNGKFTPGKDLKDLKDLKPAKKK